MKYGKELGVDFDIALSEDRSIFGSSGELSNLSATDRLAVMFFSSIATASAISEIVNKRSISRVPSKI